ncbi:hypothetical protein BIFGAL_03046 [Bifidobacterium gallicum DSM 20093 = LMG 11596]|uniref:SLH domain-containing protein n=3 Tax=Bifidobacterium gallicum TaxID=78342 RepID=D1NRU7_9BIFI|nr:hypothetical protein BIFGAL_03046 [Bifidobacterium gallicum DSM 20093 = LMG 11596]
MGEGPTRAIAAVLSSVFAAASFIGVVNHAFAQEQDNVVASECAVGSNTYTQCMPDKNLASVVAKAAGASVGDVISEQARASVTEINARNANIQDLTGLGTFTSLEHVQLSDNNIESLKPLSALTTLKSFEAYNNAIVSIDPLKNNTSLETLGVGDNKLDNISVLSNMPNLTSVNISHNNVSSIQPLASASKLEWLWASSNVITDATPVNGLTALKGADISSNTIATASGVTADPPKYLVMTGNVNHYNRTVEYGGSITVPMPTGYDGKPIVPSGINNNGTYDEATGSVTWPNNIYSGIGLIATYTSQGGGVSGDRPFSGIVRVDVTIQGSEYPEDPSPIQDPVWIKRAKEKPTPTPLAATTCTPDQSTFADCFADAKLAAKVAEAAKAAVTDVVTQQVLDSVTELYVNGAGITSLAGLEHLTNLRTIHASNNAIDNIEPLRDLTHLYDVQIYNARVTDVSPLANKPELWGLGMGNNYIENFAAMTDVPKLAWADIYDNLISDLSFVRQWPTLNALWVSGNPFKDVSPLADVKDLRRIQLESNSIEDMSPLVNTTPTEYSMNDNQTIRRDDITADEAGSVSMLSVKGRQGNYLKPKTMSPEGGVFDATTGKVTWNNVKNSGIYQFTFSESDTQDYLYSGKVQANVTVEHNDKTPPQFNGVYDTNVTLGEKYDWMYGVTATDDQDGDITDRIVIRKNDLNVNVAGTYGIRYYVEDSAGNGTWAGRKVTVSDATITKIKVWDKETQAGTKPDLGIASVEWSNGQTTYEPVVWDAITESQYAKPGKFEVHGLVRGNHDVKCTVTVKAVPVPAESVVVKGEGVSDGKLKMMAQSVHNVTARPMPANSTDTKVTWLSSDESIATVSVNGYIRTTTKTGTVKITAKIGQKESSITVTVRDRFKDVPANAQFADALDWLYTVGITQGNSDGTFGYGQTLTRQDMAVFIYRLAKLEGDESAINFKPTDKDYTRFKDVKKDSFGAKEILWMAAKGITLGNPDGTFKGSAKLTRQDAAIFLYRLAKLEGCKSAKTFAPTDEDYAKFKDVNKDTFASKEILWMASEHITNGNSDGTFGGTSRLMRQDMGVFLKRTHDAIQK